MNPAIRYTLLIIDDEPDILSSLDRLLRSDYHVLLANSVQEGLNLISQYEIHVIITDQRLPETEGGDPLSAVKGKFPATIPMVLTGHADIEIDRAAVNSGNMYSYMAKPWNPEELLVTINKACQK